MPDFEDALEAYENNDYKTAFKIFMLLAEHGDAEAQCSLGNMYSNGILRKMRKRLLSGYILQPNRGMQTHNIT